MITRIDRRLVVALAAIVLVIVVVLSSWATGPRQLDAAPVDLSVPLNLSPSELGQWCVDRKAAGTRGLTQRTKDWLTDCITLFGKGLTPGSPTPTPSATQTPSPSPSPTVQPTPSVTPPATTPPATTPPASPTPIPSSTSAVKDCLHHLAECGFPNAANTGPSGTLAVVNGNVSLNSNGMVYADTEVRGCIEVNGQDVTIRNVRVAGTGCFWGIINHSTGLTVEDSEVSCGGNGTGIGPANLYVVRTEIRQCENGFHVDGHTTVRDSWIHDMITSGGAHTDGAQFGQGAEFILLDHNTIDIPAPGGTSAVIMWDEGDPQNREVLISNNLLSGGTYTLYCGRTGAAVHVTISSNRFGPHEYGSSNGCADGGEVWTNNLDDTTGAALAP